MAVPQETRWPIDEHTKAKHAILRAYLAAWFPILGSRYPRVVYVDGFCGPGRYTGGELGSPLIALEVATGFRDRLPAKVLFLFTDERTDRIEHLRSELAGLSLPGTFSIDAEVGRFDQVFVPLLEDIEKSGSHLAPAFVFVDPFGFSGVPFAMVERVLRHPHCEVFITFMVNAVQRFVEHPYDQVRAEIESLFGTDEVRAAVAGSGDRSEALRGLYQRQLRSRARFVRSFEVRDVPGRALYHLFFASNHSLGHLKMKEAMWSADPSGGFRFVDDTDRTQLVLLDEDPIERLLGELAKHFSGRDLLSDDVLTHVADDTPFVHKHARTALKRLEERKLIQVAATKVSGEKRKNGTFPEGTRISFR